MAQQSKIQWTDATWNPWHGCRKVSAGCKFCYMFRDKERYGLDPTQIIKSKSNFNAPLKWKEPRLIFTCSWSDWFIEEADELRPEAWEIIKRTPQHTYQMLTKRPERIWHCLPPDWGDGYENVWLGVSAEDQKHFDLRVPILAAIPATVRFVSAEPLIGPIDFSSIGSKGEAIDWLIIGGESGNETGKYRYRPCRESWIFDLIDSSSGYHGCRVFVKQLGTYRAKKSGYKDRHGGDISEWPDYLQVREMPILFEHKTIQP